MSFSQPPMPNSQQRGASPVAGNFRVFKTTKGRNMMLGVGALAALGFTFMGIHSVMTTDTSPSKSDSDALAAITQVTMSPQDPAKTTPAAAVAPVVQPAEKIIYVEKAAPVIAGSADFVRMPSSSGETNFDVPAVKAQKSEEDESKKPQSDPQNPTTTQVVYKPTVIPGAKAGPAMDMTYVMRPGLYPCVLDSAMDSTIAGAVVMHFSQDVFSQNHVPLIPAGTQVTGTYKNDVKQGQNRLFSFVGYAITPEGIPVPLDSGVADGLGRAGVPGEVDNHFGSRFGAGIALSGVQNGSSLLQAYLSKGGNSYFNLNSGGSDVATEIMRQQEQQAPTVSVSPGTAVSLVIDHPIDFSDAIRIRKRER